MSALISPCERYRYCLWRGDLVKSKTLCFVMLNPSTADAETDDPTIRRCLGFMRSLGYSSLLVLNVYAYRATDPTELLTVADPCGPENDGILRAALPLGDKVICGWGTKAGEVPVRRLQRIAADAQVPLFCLTETKAGHPAHPLYLRADFKPTLWSGSWYRPGGET